MEDFQRTGGWCEAVIGNREGHFGAVCSQKRADATSISQRGWNRGRYSELSSLAEMRGMEAFFYSSLEIILKSNVV